MPFKTKESYEAIVFELSGKFLGSIEGPAFKEKLEELKDLESALLSGH